MFQHLSRPFQDQDFVNSQYSKYLHSYLSTNKISLDGSISKYCFSIKAFPGSSCQNIIMMQIWYQIAITEILSYVTEFSLCVYIISYSFNSGHPQIYFWYSHIFFYSLTSFTKYTCSSCVSILQAFREILTPLWCLFCLYTKMNHSNLLGVDFPNLECFSY